MKKNWLVIGFSCVATVLLVFILLNALYFSKREHSIRAKVVIPQTDASSFADEQGNSIIEEDSVSASFVPLLPTETLMGTLTIDFDGDGFNDQVIAIRRSGSANLFLIVGLYNPDANSYNRTAEISTEISKIRTFSYNAIDMIGNHKMALVYQGIKSNGDSVMQIFICVKRFGRVEIKKIGDFTSDGIIFIHQSDRSDAYDLSQAWGAPHIVWVYSSDKSEGFAENGNQIQTEYRWNYEEEIYKQSRQLKIAGNRMVAKELARIQNGNIETFSQFLNGLWYKTSNSGTSPSYIYFSYPEKEVIFLNDDTEGVYTWEESSLRRSGIYLTTVNSIISSIKRRFDIMLSGVDEIQVHVHDNVGMIIKESNQWDGKYKKISFQSTFGDEKKVHEFEEFVKLLGEKNTWYDDEGNLFELSENVYKITGNVDEKGLYVAFNIGDFSVIQFRCEEKSILQKAYMFSFAKKTVTIPAKNKRSKSVEQVVVDKNTIILNPVAISPNACYAADGSSIKLTRRN